MGPPAERKLGHAGRRVPTICAFDIAYYNPSAKTTGATVTFHAGNPADDPPGAVLATFGLRGLPSGENFTHVGVPASMLAQDAWLGVAFTTADAGLLIADPPFPGASDDYFYMDPPGEFYTFGSNPRGNFLMGVYATGTPVAVEPGPQSPGRSGFVVAPARTPRPGASRRASRCGTPDASRRRSWMSPGGW